MPARADTPANRWQRGSICDALYLADADQTVWAEWYRFLAEWGLPPANQLPRELWWYQVELGLADLSDAEKLAAVGLSQPRPSRRDWPPFQYVGEKLYSEGWRGIAYPSAARPRALALCIFIPFGSEAIDGVEPLPPPTLIREVPPPPSGMTT